VGVGLAERRRGALTPDERLGAPGRGDRLSSYLGLRWEDAGTIRLTAGPELLNHGGMLLGPVGFALVDYGMGTALWDQTTTDEGIATTNIALNFVAAATAGELVCRSTVDHRSRRAASLRSEVYQGKRLVITAIGTFAVFPLDVYPTHRGNDQAYQTDG